MDIFSKIAGFFAGGDGLAKTISDTVMAYWPPDMSPEKKVEAQLAVSAQSWQREKEGLVLAHEMDKEFNQRIKDLEGTAADLKSIPFFGNILLFLRGSQRPTWGFTTMYMDFMWISKGWDVPENSQKGLALIVINVLVLGFLFGERAIQNVMPYIIQFFGIKGQAKAEKEP